MARSGILLNAEYDHQRLMELATRAEAVGFDDFWYADERFYREPYIGLAACALATRRMRLGPGVTDPYTRHPALTAAAIASLDELSKGRAVLGLGAGLSGFRNLGLRPERSAAKLRDSVTILRRLWAGETVTYEGKEISIWDARMKFPTRATIPICLAANGPLNFRLAGEVADEVMIPHCASVRIFASQMAHVRTGQARVGRTQGPEVIVRLDASVSRNRAAAMDAARVRIARLLWAQYPTIPYLEQHGLELPTELDRRLQAAGPFPGGHNLDLFRPFASAIPEELVTPIALAGTPDEVAAQAQAVIDAGADQVMVYLLVPEGATIEQVTDLYGREVLAQLRSR